MKSAMPRFKAVLFTLLLGLVAVYADDDKLIPSETTPSKSLTDDLGNVTSDNVTTATTKQIPFVPAALPPKGDAEKEHRSSMAIVFILVILVVAILMVHFFLKMKLHFIPDSLAVVFLGSVVGFALSLTGKDWTNEEAFSPNMFFLVLLPPIIFESGYNLHKGNFFANFGSIVVFAVIGTMISAAVIGAGVYILGEADLIYKLTPVQSFAFGCMISAVDPVATLAIFQAIKVDPVLYMLVFGESMLNDAVAIVLTTTVLELDRPSMSSLSPAESFISSVGRFCLMFFGSAFIGVIAALVSALILKYMNLHNTPSLEYGFVLLFAYIPYGLAEALNLSGIMAILFCGIGMSHYTHFNLSAVTQVTVQQTFRTLAFMAGSFLEEMSSLIDFTPLRCDGLALSVCVLYLETCVFAYLGMALFTFPLSFKPAFICWCIILCLFARALNIFPLSRILNRFREHQISTQMQFLMWFSGLRGAIAFALSLHLDLQNARTRRVVITSTLAIVLFTIVVFGGSTMPLIKMLTKRKEEHKPPKRRRRRSRNRRLNGATKQEVALSKTHEMGSTIEAENWSYSEQTESEDNAGNTASMDFLRRPVNIGGLAKLDAHYLRPFFTRKFTQKEKKANTMKLTNFALQWYREVQAESEESDNAGENGIDLKFPSLDADLQNMNAGNESTTAQQRSRRDSYASSLSAEDDKPLIKTQA